MALKAHWLDSVIGDLTDPKEIGEAIAASPQFQKIVLIGCDKAKTISDMNAGTKNIGSVPAQTIRLAIISGITSETGQVDTD